MPQAAPPPVRPEDLAQYDGRWTVLFDAARSWRVRPGLAAVALFALLVQQGVYIGTAFSLHAVIEAVQQHQPGRLARVLVFLSIGFVLAAGATVVGERAAARASAELTNDLRRRLYDRVLKASPSYLAGTSAAKLNNTLTNSLHSLEAGYVAGFLDAVTLVASAAIALPLMAILDGWLTVFCLVAVPVVIALADRRLPLFVRAKESLSTAETSLTAAVQETVSAHELLQTFSLEPLFAERFEGLLAGYARHQVSARTARAAVGKGASLGVLLVEVLVVITGAELSANGQLAVSSLVAFYTVLALLTRVASDFVRTDLPLLADAGRSRASVDNLLQAPLAVEEAVPGLHLRAGARPVELTGVTFTYPDRERPAVADVSLTVRAGATVAVVGASGSGKSTLLRLLLRLYDPQQGSVRLAGHDLRTIASESLHAVVGAVPHQSYLFNDTIWENLRVAKPSATDEEVVDAARQAHLHDVVTALPDGYATRVGEGGSLLSVGQRQRLAIARAILRAPEVLLLDEVTTGLDPATEQDVQSMLDEFGRGRTVVTATHRLAVARGADHIVVLRHGVVVEQGRHDDLVAAGGEYQRLWEKQAGFAVRGDGRSARVDPARLRQIRLFADVDDATLARVAARLTSEYVDADRTVIQQGDRGDRFYLLVRGRVSVTATGPGGREHVLDALTDGDHFGELALLQDRPRTATVRTTLPSVFLTLDREAFLDLVASTPAMRPALEDRVEQSELNLSEWRRLVERTS